MHSCSSVLSVPDEADEPLVSHGSTESGHGASATDDPPDLLRSQIVAPAPNVDLRPGNQAATPRSRNTSAVRSLSSPALSHASSRPATPTSGAKSAPDMIAVGSRQLYMEGSPEAQRARQFRMRSPWVFSIMTLSTALAGILILLAIMHSFVHRPVGADGCEVPVMSPTYLKMIGFDAEHTRFASKYNLFLYREEGVDPYSHENIGVRRLTLTVKLFTRIMLTDPAFLSSTVSPCCFFPEMPVVTSKFDLWPPKHQDIMRGWCNMTVNA